MKTGKTEPESYGQMVTQETERKRNSLYGGRPETVETNNQQIRNIMSMTTAQLEALSVTDRRISLTDTEAVKQQTLLYLRACTEAATIPTFVGVSRSCGYTRQAVQAFAKRNPDHPTTIWFALIRDSISEALANAAMSGSVKEVISIFVLKSVGNWHENDGSLLDDTNPYEMRMTADQIIKKYKDIDLPD